MTAMAQEQQESTANHQLLPVLSKIAQRIVLSKSIDKEFLSSLLSTSGFNVNPSALEELQKWSDLLLKVSSKQGEEESIIGQLQDIGVPEASAVLAVNAVLNPPIQKSLAAERKKFADIYTAKSSEPYHKWLPDHLWHYDLDWNTLPLWIKRDTSLVQQLTYGRDVLSRFIRYSLDEKGLKRKLHDQIPVFLPLRPRERYYDWLPDHEWHNDLDEAHLPQWIINDGRRLNDLINGRDVLGKYVRYRFQDNRLLRKLHDSIYVQLNINQPVERYHTWLPDHNWHNDLDWRALQTWIKSNVGVMDELKRGHVVAGKFVLYKYENNRLLRRLRDGTHIKRR